MPRALLIEHVQLSSDEFMTVSGDPDSEEELPDRLDIIVNHEAERYFVQSIQAFVESIPNLGVEAFIPTGRQWFGFVLSGDVDLDVIKDRFEAAFRGGEYRIISMAWGSEDISTTSLSNLLEELSQDSELAAALSEEPSLA
ncbi:MAG: hypothetical protein ABIG32_01945 [Candidatus Uhrbacteria bacterium]|nr:hypothetical protein [Patescibacteria group bacterium]MBU1907055.1 hypothetical protein [Patescibacteria group bacterium]